MCDCLNKVREEVKKGLAEENKTMKWLRFNLSTIVSRSNPKENMTGQAIDLCYTYVNKKGEEKEKTEKSFVAHDYCPFCGRKYKQ